MKIIFFSDINSVKWLCSGAETDVENYGVNSRKHSVLYVINMHHMRVLGKDLTLLLGSMSNT